MNSDLHTFVREALSRGASRDTIRAALRDARWPEDEVESALAAWHDAGLGLPVPRRRVGVSPREAFLYLLLFVSLYLVAYGVGAILFAWIERTWPDAAVFDSVADPRRDSVRFSVATLLVAFPVFLLTAWNTGRAVARDPEKRNSGVRRWLTYLTLFNAACLLIGDFIVVLQGMLKGELTVRFASKAAVVALIGGWLFTHYMGGLKRDEEEVPRRATPSWLARAAGAVVVLVTLLGLAMAGTPAQVRRAGVDQRRVYDLEALSDVVTDFERVNKYLPRDRDELSRWNPQITRMHEMDPATGVPYEYQPLDSLDYRLCAAFDAPDSVGPYSHDVHPFWRHGAGRTCFTFHLFKPPPGR